MFKNTSFLALFIPFKLLLTHPFKVLNQSIAQMPKDNAVTSEPEKQAVSPSVPVHSTASVRPYEAAITLDFERANIRRMQRQL